MLFIAILTSEHRTLFECSPILHAGGYSLISWLLNEYLEGATFFFLRWCVRVEKTYKIILLYSDSHSTYVFISNLLISGHSNLSAHYFLFVFHLSAYPTKVVAQR